MKKYRWLPLLLALTLFFTTACGPSGEPTKTTGTQGGTVTEPDQKITESSAEQTITQEGTVSNETEGTETSDEPVRAQGGTFVSQIVADPQVMNPLCAYDDNTVTVTNIIFAPLFVLDAKKGETRYYLAESVDISDDGLTYTVKLKENLKWHDGEPIDADDLMFTLHALLEEDSPLRYAGYFRINGEPVTVNKIDDLTVDIVLPAVSVPFLTNLAKLRPLPEHYYDGEEDLSTSALNDKPLGSGPFKFKSLVSGEYVELERFDDYFDGAPYLDKIVFSIISDSDAANTAMLNGELDGRRLTVDDVDTFEDNDNVTVNIDFSDRIECMVLKQSNEALQNKEVRQAIAYGIDKNEIIQGVFQSSEYASPAYSVFGPDTLYQTEDVEKYERNVEKAKQLLNGAGYETLELRFAYNNSFEDVEAAALIIQQQLAEVGINIELMPLEGNDFTWGMQDSNSTDFDLFSRKYATGYEPSEYRWAFLSGDMYNFMKYENPELDQLWSDGMVEMDEARRRDIYETIQQTIIDDVALYPLYYPMTFYVMNKRIGGLDEAMLSGDSIEDYSKLYIIE